MEKSILLVEDSADAAELTMQALRECGKHEKLVVASDGQEAIDFLLGAGNYAGRDVGKAPGMVLLDLRLPKMSGFEVLEKIRSEKATRYLPVVIHTVSRLKSDVRRAYDLGANSYIIKPEDYEKYVSRLKKLCDYWLWTNVVP